jgi:hypothetical protein
MRAATPPEVDWPPKLNSECYQTQIVTRSKRWGLRHVVGRRVSYVGIVPGRNAKTVMANARIER